MNKQQEQAFRFLTEYPAQYGQMVGFADLRNDLHGKWIRQMVMGHSDMTLQSHRGSYKTTCLEVSLAEIIMLCGNKNTIFFRKTDTDVIEVIKQVHKILEHPVSQELYKALTGQYLNIEKSTSAEITTSSYTAASGASQLLGIGINGSLTGKHGDIIVTDDIVNLKDRTSRAEREHTKSVYMELQNLKNRNGGRIINTGTPWHKEDAFSIMPPPMVFDCYCTGLISKDELEDIRSKMTPSLFAANYELRHIASENALFTETTRFTSDKTMLYDGLAHIDAAYDGEDYTAFTLAKRRGDTIFMYGKMWRAHVDTVVDSVIADCKRYRCEPILCELNGDKGYLAKELKQRGVFVRPYQENMNKFVKISIYLRKWWGNIVWVEGTDPNYLAQIQDFTEDAAHDDAPDSAACLCRRLDKAM